MYDLFEVIVNHPTFDSAVEDGFGESLLESLLYMYTAEETQSNAEEERILRRLIDSVLKNDSYAFNATDINKDTALNISCEFKCLNWVTRELLLKKDIDINVINDAERSALTTAIEQKNIEAIRMLSKMRGLVVRDIDREAAKEADIDLSEYGL